MQTYDFNHLREQLKEHNQVNVNKVANEKDFVLFDDLSMTGIGNESLRLKDALLGICTAGEHEIIIDSHSVIFGENDYIVLFPNQVVSMASNQVVKGIFVCISLDSFEKLSQHMHNLIPLFLFVRDHPCQQLKKSDVTWFRSYYRRLFDELADSTNIFRYEIAEALFQVVLYKVCGIYGSNIIAEPSINNRQEEIFGLFIRELTLSFRKHREVGYYADKLFITPKYLSTTVKRISGRSANHWIQSYVLQEAKLLLKNTHKPIKQIANELNFPTQSFFGKYFKQYIGISPQQYRRQKG